MSHKSGHIIIDLTLPHDDEEEQENGHIRKEPCVSMKLDAGCTETDCVESARLAYRKLMRRA